MITGPINACEYTAPNGTAAVYSVNNIPGNTYNWAVPAGATGLTGQGSNSISFIFPQGFSTGVVSVTTSNACGTSPVRSLTISRLLPASPGNIASSLIQDCPGRIYTYSLPGTPLNSTSVNWTVPTGGTITGGQGTNSITVSYSVLPASGHVTAQSVANCSNSSIRSLRISLPGCVPAGPRFATIKNAGQKTLPLLKTGVDMAVSPNPSYTGFQLKLFTETKLPASISISDIQGREISRLTAAPGESMNFGNDFKSGTYLVTIRQGNITKTLKIIKL